MKRSTLTSPSPGSPSRSFTFAEVLGVEGQAVSGQGLQQQLVAGPPAWLRDGGRHALHGRHALEERRLAVEANELVELRQDAVALDLLLLRQLRVGRGWRVSLGRIASRGRWDDYYSA